jgi:hypothetical protein
MNSGPLRYNKAGEAERDYKRGRGVVRLRSWASDRSVAERFVNSPGSKRSAGGFKGEARRSFAGKSSGRGRGSILVARTVRRGRECGGRCGGSEDTLAGKVAPDRQATELEYPCLVRT